MDDTEYAALVAGFETMVLDLYRVHGLSQAQIAARAHLSRNTVWRAFNRQLKIPAYDTVLKIAALHAEVVSKRSNLSQRVS